jgi:uronate dehydrogenase
MAASRTVLLTGAAGRIGVMLRERLPALGWTLRLHDRTAVVPAAGQIAVTAGLEDSEALRTAMRGTDAVIHLAAHPGERSFPDILRNNIMGSYQVYEAARLEGVPRVIAGSSNHAVGFEPAPADIRAADTGDRIPVDIAHRPDTYYGLSKCFGEDLAQLYWDRLSIETVSLRIGACRPEPRSARELAIWLSPDDCARLVHAALTAPRVGHTIVYGCSANTRGVLDLSSAEAIGYHPQDNSETYAHQVLSTPDAHSDWPGTGPIGGRFATGDADWPDSLRRRG